MMSHSSVLLLKCENEFTCPRYRYISFIKDYCVILECVSRYNEINIDNQITIAYNGHNGHNGLFTATVLTLKITGYY